MQNSFKFSVTRMKNSHSSAATLYSPYIGFFICVSAFMLSYCPLFSFFFFLIVSFSTFQLCRHAVDKNTAFGFATSLYVSTYIQAVLNRVYQLLWFWFDFFLEDWNMAQYQIQLKTKRK